MSKSRKKASHTKEPVQPTTESASAENTPSRRRFFWQVWLVLGGLAVLEYVWLVVDFLRPARLNSSNRKAGNQK